MGPVGALDFSSIGGGSGRLGDEMNSEWRRTERICLKLSAHRQECLCHRREGLKPPVRANPEIGAPFGVEVLQVKSRFLTSRTPFGMTVFAGLNILCGGVDILLDRFDQAGEDGDGDGDVADGDQDGDDFGDGAEDWGVDGMAEAQGLEDAPKAVIEVIAEHDHGDDVEERDGPDWKPVTTLL